jgi:ankyrin repeat protein
VHADNNWALRWASRNGHLEMVKVLLDAGADVHAKDDQAAYWASYNGHIEVFKLLKQYSKNK